MKRTQRLPGIKILVVDDEPDLRDILRSRLQMEGCQVELAENGETALKILQDASFNAVISDIRMPGGSGTELLEAFWSQVQKNTTENAHPDCNQGFPAFILISGFSDMAPQDALARGATALLVKPFDLDDMISAVSDAVKKKEQS